ncbi:hypothetical protein FPV67DRAFT_1449142 [Lyophyllum atratum]|nr:hypothetical protein FPV67DRAFT_1449142 [Lyophyllum atratum]
MDNERYLPRQGPASSSGTRLTDIRSGIQAHGTRTQGHTCCQRGPIFTFCGADARSAGHTLMAYRLLDLDLSRRGSRLQALIPGSTLPLVSKRTKVPLEELNDLQKIITRSNKVLEDRDKAAAKKKKATALPASSSVPSTNSLIGLYTHLAKSVQKVRWKNIVINLSAAAIHLAYLLQGNVYLPTNTSEIEEFIMSSSTSDDDHHQMDRIRLEFGAGTQGCSSTMHKTLFLALAVSPLMLLMPRSYEQSAGKAALLETWAQFGSIARPSYVVSADTAVWKVLFAATKGGDILADLRVALSELEPALSVGTSPWFALTTQAQVPHALTSQTSMLVEVESDSEDGPSVVLGLSDNADSSVPGDILPGYALTADVTPGSPVSNHPVDFTSNPVSSDVAGIPSSSPSSSDHAAFTEIPGSHWVQMTIY